jgi:hypothetical protein
MNKDKLFNKINLYKLCDWVDNNEINWYSLSQNKNAVHIL